MEQSQKMVFRYAFVLFKREISYWKTHDTKMEGKKNENVKISEALICRLKSVQSGRKKNIEKVLSWCTDGLHDGKSGPQIPMSLEQKIEFFKLLVKLALKKLRLVFRAASGDGIYIPQNFDRAGPDPGGCNYPGSDSGKRTHYQKTFEVTKAPQKDHPCVQFHFCSTERAGI